MRQTFWASAMLLAMGQFGLAGDDKPAAEGKDATEAVAGDSVALKYHDGTADGKKSIAGTGEMITFGAPAGTKIEAIRIHGSRYGVPKAPDESFVVYVLSGDQKRVLHTELVPYSTFERGEEKWVTIKLSQPVEVTPRFWVTVDFRAQATKGVYVSYDTSTGGKNSRVGLPGLKASEPKDKGDWMIEAVPAS